MDHSAGDRVAKLWFLFIRSGIVSRQFLVLDQHQRLSPFPPMAGWTCSSGTARSSRFPGSRAGLLPRSVYPADENIQ